MSKILVPVDGSQNALRAAAFTAGMAAAVPGTEVTLLYVVVPLARQLKSLADIPLPDVEEIVQRHVRESVAEAAGVFVAKGLPVESAVVYGDPGESIARYVEDHGFDQIVMGTRGLGDLKGLIMGSVSHQVIHLAKCPVTLVK